MKIPFTKMHGLGNNYIYIDFFEFQIEENRLSKLAIDLSNVNTGIGSDGMILICPSDVADVKMRIFNSDGSEGKNCGNGLRCVAKYSYEKGIVSNKKFRIETLGGIVAAEVIGESEVSEVTINMGHPSIKNKEIPILTGGESTVDEWLDFGEFSFQGTAVSMGNPHIVFVVDDVEEIPLSTVGPIIQNNPMFPESVNVEFIHIQSENKLRFKVWERGSGITQACGTGACAAVVSACLLNFTKRDEDVLVQLDGGTLKIKWASDGNVWMTGPATRVCTGEYFYEK